MPPPSPGYSVPSRSAPPAPPASPSSVRSRSKSAASEAYSAPPGDFDDDAPTGEMAAPSFVDLDAPSFGGGGYAGSVPEDDAIVGGAPMRAESPPSAPRPTAQTPLPRQASFAHTVERKLAPAKEAEEKSREAEPYAPEAPQEEAAVTMRRARRSTSQGLGSAGPARMTPPTPGYPSTDAPQALGYPTVQRADLKVPEPLPARKKSPMLWVMLGLVLAIIALLIWWLTA
jgi:hypothetical protein